MSSEDSSDDSYSSLDSELRILEGLDQHLDALEAEQSQLQSIMHELDNAKDRKKADAIRRKIGENLQLKRALENETMNQANIIRTQQGRPGFELLGHAGRFMDLESEKQYGGTVSLYSVVMKTLTPGPGRIAGLKSKKPYRPAPRLRDLRTGRFVRLTGY